MQYGNRWSAFLCNGTNKTELLKLIGVSMDTEEMKNLFRIPFIFTTEDKTYELKHNRITQIGSSNHEEADTRLVLHALSSQNDVVIVCEDTDVMILMVWAYVKFNVSKNWYMKYEDDKYACIKDIVDYIGEEISLCLPQIHGITGCDTTSAFFMMGKVKVLKKIQKDPVLLSLIKNIGAKITLDKETMELASEFARKVIYKGKPKEDYIDTRIRLFTSSASKSTLMIPPDPDSLAQAIKRVHYQVYIWLRSNETHIKSLKYQEFGWEWCEERKMVWPVWFVGLQIPPEAKKKSRNRVEKGDDADDEGDGSCINKPKGKRRAKCKGTAAKKQKLVPKEDTLSVSVYDDHETTDEDIDFTLGEEEDELCEISDNSDWELSDFLSSSDSDEEWNP